MPNIPRAPRGFTGPDAPDPAIARRCVRCGLCLPGCPTYQETQRETSSPRGRIHLISAVADGRLDLLDLGFTGQMAQCLNCRACEAACPSGVEYGQLVEGARAEIARATQHSAGQLAGTGALRAIFGDLRRFRRLTGLMRTYQRSGGQWAARRSRVLALLGLGDAEAMLPPVPATPFVPAGQRVAANPSAGAERPPVAFFAGCVMSTVLAPTDFATVRVLAAFGHPVVAPAGQECCGALATHAGQPDLARDLARRNIAAFEVSGAALIVNNAAGCGSALKEYGQLLASDPVWAARATAFSARVRDLSEVLAEDLAAGAQPALQPVPLRVTFQEPCHLAHAQRITRQPRALLGAIPGLELVEQAESALCCGSAGIYNLTQPAMAGRLQRRKVANIQATDAPIVVTANPGCFFQVRAGLRRAGSAQGVLHLADLLDASLRGQTPAEIVARARA